MAEQYLVNHADMVSVADAIRGKAGVEDELTFPAGFVGAVEGIQAGGGGGGGDIDALIDGTVTEIHNDNVTDVKKYTFHSCLNLTNVAFAKAASIGDYAFYNCTRLTNAAFAKATSIGQQAFYACVALTNVEFPSVTSIGQQAFRNCNALAYADFPKVTKIDANSLRNCPEFKTLILRAGNVASLGSSALSSTHIDSGTGYIYVPASLIDSYKAATNWSAYAAQFRALEDYTVDGTITGELDESKI